MNKVWLIAVREFVSVVTTKAFIIGLLVVPAMIAIGILAGPRLFGNRDFSIEGQIAVVDDTGLVIPELQTVLTAGRSPEAVAELVESARGAGAGDAILDVLAAPNKLALVELPSRDNVEARKAWLLADGGGVRRLALAIIHGNAVQPTTGESVFGSYDLYVPQNHDDRTDIAVQSALRDAIINARMHARDLDRASLTALVSVPRVRSVTVAAGGDRGTVGMFNTLLPAAFMMLLFLGVMGAGQGMLTTTIEEKSSRVIEVLLSAVSPLQLMAGKLLGHMGVSLLAMSLYVGLGLLGLASLSLFGLLDISLIGYLLIFFLIAFFTIGSLMMAAGSAVNDMREAQSLMMPMTILFVAPWFLWMPISRNPDSSLSLVVSFLPPVNTFGMLLRIASTNPPPAWQIWLSILIGIVGVFGAIWFAAKVFRIGLLMFGKPPDFRTLITWVRMA